MTGRRVVRAGAVVALVALAGCAASGDEVAEVPYERPGWMAEQAQVQDEYRESLQSCVRAKDWNVTVDRYGGVVEPFDTADVPRWEADRDACLAEMGVSGEARLDRERAELLYDRQVDTWRCVLDLGYDVPEPPSQETFVEALLGGGTRDWHPYGDLVGAIPWSEWEALEETCPQPWWAD